VSSRDQTEFGDHPRVAENRETRFGIAKRDSNHIPAAVDRSIALPRLRAPKLQRLTSIALEAITSFLCGRHFLHLFSSREGAAATRGR
jgi:hypothetical protein